MANRRKGMHTWNLWLSDEEEEWLKKAMDGQPLDSMISIIIRKARKRGDFERR